MNSTRRRLLLPVSITVAMSIALVPMTATKRVSAATITVMNTNDSGAGSLRQAIIDANSGDTIDFSVTGTITLTSGELLLNKSLTITGPGAASLTISGNNASRVLEIASGVTVMMSGLTISDGNCAGCVGGSIGGGISSSGTLTLSDTVLSGNSATVAGGIFNNLSSKLTITNSTLSGNSAQAGGGILNNGMLTLTNSTLWGNAATPAGGGGIFNNGLLTITNCTLSGNSGPRGGGINAPNQGTVNISFTTLSGNSASVSGGGIFNDATMNIKNSIIANSTSGGDCTNFATFHATGVNFSTNGACPGFTQVTPAQLNLGPLANNGGPTMTHALLAGSVAIDAVTDCTDVSGSPVTTDQRGATRPVDGDGNGSALCDAGSFESQCITCPSNITKPNDTDQCGAVVNYPSPAATESCSPFGCSPESGSFYPVGTTTVTCSSKQDVPFFCSFAITVKDTQAPAITCPADKQLQCGDSTDPTNTGTATATDNCGTVTISHTDAPTAPNCSGKAGIDRTWKATDSSGNTSACVQHITFVDTTPPVITCPGSVSATAAASCPIAASKSVSFTVSATDNCGGTPSVVCTPPSGAGFPVGTTTVNCTATDGCGNVASCSFPVTVFSLCLQDETNPGNFVLINASTGEYSFFCNGGLIAGGTGTLTVKGCQGSIDQVKGDRRVHMEWDTVGAGGKGAGTAIVQVGVNNTKCQITDKDMSNNTCTASAPPPATPIEESGKQKQP